MGRKIRLQQPLRKKKKKRPSKRKPGAPPGSLVFVGEKHASDQTIEIIDFQGAELKEMEVDNVTKCFPFKEKESVTWINVTGLHEVNAIGELGKGFGLHPLLIEDILNTGHRPKFEDQQDYIFLTLKMLTLEPDSEDTTPPAIRMEQVSLVIGRNFVLSFQEREGDVFDPIRQRIRNQKGLIRKSGMDYLGYTLIDAIVDHYILVAEELEYRTEQLEEWILQGYSLDSPEPIQNLKKDSMEVRKAVLPLREAMRSLLNADSPLISPQNSKYFRDVFDHLLSLISSIETQREMNTSLMDIHMSMQSNRMNAIMKVLTVIASIFIPLTFIAGIYGMNFENMPELQWQYGYPAALGAMALVGVGMAVFFRWNKWM